ncbi:unnamed protein product [Brugia timori]|uniref:Reverse transcriptase domain-containing protein n=1 Tax=Brugia timori TaxID=42155 RepID=A0A0R3Q573_9BILA|nr:unnamed protein product [Brugia timori]
MKKALNPGLYWTNYFENDEGQKIYNRKELNKLVTDYYSKLYADDATTNSELAEIENMEEEPYFLEREIETIINQLKPDKSPGHDGITNEHIKAGGRKLITLLTKLFNRILKTGTIPTEWKRSNIIILHKKGDRHKIGNYRPITLSLTIAKIFSKLIETRIQKLLIEHQPIEQAGFRKTFSTIDHLQSINQIIEKSTEYQITLYIALIDYNKAFDSLKHQFMLRALKNQGIPEKLVRIIEELYRGLKARIMTDEEGEYFEINKGVKQGDPLSPILFNSSLEEIFRNLNWEEKGLDVNGKKLTNLRFADDVILFANSEEELTVMINELSQQSVTAGLTMNAKKTKILTNKTNQKTITINGNKIDITEDATYLGQTISFTNRTDKEVNTRVTKAWAKYWSLRNIFKGPFNIYHKCQIFNMCIIPTLTYGCQTWTLKKNILEKIRVTQNAMERSMLNVRIKDKIRIEKIKRKLKFNEDAIRYVRRQKWGWAGHITRLNDDRWTYLTTFWQPRNGKRRRGKQKKRWKEDFENFLRHKTFDRIAQNRKEWERLQETFALYGPENLWHGSR